MSKSYQTVSSSLFLNSNHNNIPQWIESIDLDKLEIPENKLINDTLFEKKAAFNYMPAVSRDNRDFNTRPINNTFNNNKLILAAKIELSRFLGKHHYTTEINNSNSDAVTLSTNIVNIPATFLFTYMNHQGRVKAANLFTINTKDDIVGEYPFNKAGFNECLSDIKSGRIKTGEKAKAYKAYTITLAEIVRRYNGDQRAAMDKVRELVASQDIIGVESNTFATCYAIDSLFPQMKKEGTLDKEVPFEFMKNIEHVAAKSSATDTALMIEASKKLHNLFDNYQILSFERKNNSFKVEANVLYKKQLNKVAFNFNINTQNINNIPSETLTGIAYCDVNDQHLSLQNFLNNTSSNLLQAYTDNNNINEKHIYHGTILTKDNIIDKLKMIVDKSIIDDIIENWTEQQLIKPINSNTYVSQYPFIYLLNQVNTKLLTKEEQQKLYNYSSRIISNLDRIDQKDDVRDYDIVYSPSIRLANLFNHINQFLDNFIFKTTNKDCTQVVITNYSERGPEDLVIIASYDGNNCKQANIKANKNITAALKKYKKINKHNIFAKAVITESLLHSVVNRIFKNPDQVINNIKQDYLQKIGSNLYASPYPLATIINYIKNDILTDQEQKDLLAKQAKDNFVVTANYEKDLIRNSIDYSRTIRLASVYNLLSKQLPNFALNNYNKDCSQINILVKDEKGMYNLTVQAKFNDNKCIDIKLPKQEDNTQGLNIYKQANKKNIFANAIFSKRMLLNVFSNIFSEPEKIIDIVLTKIAKPIGNNYYASKYPLSAIIQSLAQHNYSILSENERKNLNKIKQYFGKKIQASYEKDTGIRQNLIYSSAIRLANLYPSLTKKYGNFTITDINKDATHVEIGQVSPVGLNKYILQVEYNHNMPIKIAKLQSNEVKPQEIIQCYQQEHGKAIKVAKSIFSKNMLKQALKTLVNTEDIDDSINKIINNTEKLPNDFYASDKPLTYLINNSDIKFNPNYIPKIENQINREEVIDTGDRKIEFTDNLISAINKASKYLNEYFKNIKFNNAKLDNEILNYNCTLFDEDTGLKNDLDCQFQFKNGQIVDCKVNLQQNLIKLDKVKQAFAISDTLSKYLKYNSQKKTNAPIIISVNHLKDKLANLIINKDDIITTIDQWNKLGRIKKVASNAYASNFTLEQLISLSSLKALSDEEIKYKLGKRLNLLKVSKIDVQDTKDRKIQTEWTVDKYLQFIRNELDKISDYSQVLNISLDDQFLTLKAEIGKNGLRNTIDIKWNIENGRPTDMTYNLPNESNLVKSYINKYASKNAFKIQFNMNQLENNLFGFVDKDSIHLACDKFLKKNILTKKGNIFYSQYSIPELLRFMEKYNFINKEKIYLEQKMASRQEVKSDYIAYQENDASRILQKDDSVNIHLQNACNKLKNNIILAANNKLITKNKENIWLNILNTCTVANIEKVHKEFKEYLKR